MAKVKMSKKATAVDMTAMCDVAFLLLTFFILTATAKQPEIVPVETPASTVQVKLPESDLAIITIANGGKVFFGVKAPDVRIKTLELISEQYKLSFTEEEKKRFSLMEEFGVPVNQLNGLIKLSSTDRNNEGVQIGIPHDSLDNQLKEWVRAARNANAEVNEKQLNFAIKGDAKEQYPEIKKIMDILQEQKVNKFNLVTGLRGE
ncbi:ExbD/TolR family protein [Flavobacterium sp. SM2513]|uniref:ExbD/TolR family protein n=1 Tax=Flavobacterium sp. SM2513 TaxID=3424766 RepID=UPI003D7FA223